MNVKNVTLLLVSIVLLIGCNNDDDSSIVSSDLAGVWHGVSVDYVGSTVTSGQGVSLKVDFVGEGYDINYDVTFNDAVDNMSASGSYGIKITTTFNGQSSVVNEEGLTFENEGSFSLEGDKIILEDGTIFTIVTLTETTLELNILDENTIEENGLTVVTTIDGDFTYIR